MISLIFTAYHLLSSPFVSQIKMTECLPRRVEVLLSIGWHHGGSAREDVPLLQERIDSFYLVRLSNNKVSIIHNMIICTVITSLADIKNICFLNVSEKKWITNESRNESSVGSFGVFINHLVEGRSRWLHRTENPRQNTQQFRLLKPITVLF